MTSDTYNDATIAGILSRVRTIAMVGASANPVRPSYFAMKYLQAKGYRVIPVNPGHAGETLLGETVHARATDIAVPVDMLDLFRAAPHAPQAAHDAIAIGAGVLWLQLGVHSAEAAEIAEAAGLAVVMNRCPKIEYGRLSGEIGWAGVNRAVLSARRPLLGAGRRQTLVLG